MAIKTHSTLLMTGAAGGLGAAMRSRLKQNCDVLRLSDRAATRDTLGSAKPGEEIVLADLAQAHEVEAAVQGCQAVVHFGGISVEGPFEPILQANILGMYNLYEAARKHGVRRIVFASSNHVTGFYRQSETITTSHPPRPDSLYGVSKAFGEDLSRMYFDRYGIETACVRIGSSFPEPKDRRMLASWLSYDDLHRLIVACLSTPVLGHSIVFGVSDNAVRWYDNSGARHVGFVPQDSSDVFKEAVYARTPEPDLNDPAVQYQGGGFLFSGIPMTAHKKGS
ncbi:NAD-dependent epimerase/dehydratase family protein [Rhodoferax sp.]|jgi:uronate dehydrogenase|uniref:NAD-dependent epimerase/dehydratase family protein n=1 Tax=Rhodoferax sp. TaxID=50421 RepID=UPI0037853204